MSSTINPPDNNIGPERVNALFESLARGEREEIDVSPLSDLSRPAFTAMQQHWETLDLNTRRFLMRRITESARGNIELNFERMLRHVLSDPDPENRALSIAGLWEDETPSFLNELLRIAEIETEPVVLEAVATALGHFCLLAETGSLDSYLADRVRDRLFALLEPSNDTGPRQRALEALGYLSDDFEVMTEISDAYQSPNEAMRLSALIAMGRNLDERWFDTLFDELSHEEPEFREEAARAIGQFEDERAVGPLFDLCFDEDPDVQLAAIAALGEIGGRQARQALNEVTQVDDEALRNAAREALALTDELPERQSLHQ